MWKKVILIVIYLFICILIYQKYSINSTSITTTIKEKISTPITRELPIGYLNISKINLSEKLYNIDSKENTIEKHVTILPVSKSPEEKNTTIFIAAHSGTGRIAYFKNLDKLSKTDRIKLTYKNKEYTYEIKNIWETKKIGTISIPKANTNQLVLTTCSPNKEGYQLIIDSHIIHN